MAKRFNPIVKVVLWIMFAGALISTVGGVLLQQYLEAFISGIMAYALYYVVK